jgi:hypothetical protein
MRAQRRADSFHTTGDIAKQWNSQGSWYLCSLLKVYGHYLSCKAVLVYPVAKCSADSPAIYHEGNMVVRFSTGIQLPASRELC